ncbi:MAG: hypothetical protein [Caudoviricetes sp.]|nr:MAG: hypothetical protein [Caudoviricetes sp.]
MSRTFRRVNKYVSYCTLSRVQECNSELQIALMNPEKYRHVMKYKGYDEEYAARFYRDGYFDRFTSSNSFRKNDVDKARERAYYKNALNKCLKFEERDYEIINIRKKLAGFRDW